MVNFKLQACRACNHDKLTIIHDFGCVPDAGDFQSIPFSGDKHRLRLIRCDSCGLVQIDGRLDRDTIFRNYKYSSGTSSDLVNHFKDLAREVNQLGKNLRILEIGCNDGTLMQLLKLAGHNCVGIDPSDIAAESARLNHWNLVNDYFSLATADLILDRYGEFDLVVSCNSFAHNDQILELSQATHKVLKKGGLAMIEVQDFSQTLLKNQFDTIYREHVCYFTSITLSELLFSVGLLTIKVEPIQIHNGSIRVLSMKNDGSHSLQASEFQDHLETIDVSSMVEMIDTISSEIKQLAYQGKKVAAYGASGRATNILCQCGLNARHVSVIFDNSSSKIDLYIPSTDIPIVRKSSEHINEFDYIFITAWNYKDQIIHELRTEYSYSGRFLVPLPSIEYL